MLIFKTQDKSALGSTNEQNPSLSTKASSKNEALGCPLLSQDFSMAKALLQGQHDALPQSQSDAMSQSQTNAMSQGLSQRQALSVPHGMPSGVSLLALLVVSFTCLLAPAAMAAGAYDNYHNIALSDSNNAHVSKGEHGQTHPLMRKALQKNAIAKNNEAILKSFHLADGLKVYTPLDDRAPKNSPAPSRELLNSASKALQELVRLPKCRFPASENYSYAKVDILSEGAERSIASTMSLLLDDNVRPYIISEYNYYQKHGFVVAEDSTNAKLDAPCRMMEYDLSCNRVIATRYEHRERNGYSYVFDADGQLVMLGKYEKDATEGDFYYFKDSDLSDSCILQNKDGHSYYSYDFDNYDKPILQQNVAPTLVQHKGGNAPKGLGPSNVSIGGAPAGAMSSAADNSSSDNGLVVEPPNVLPEGMQGKSAVLYQNHRADDELGLLPLDEESQGDADFANVRQMWRRMTGDCDICQFSLTLMAPKNLKLKPAFTVVPFTNNEINGVVVNYEGEKRIKDRSFTFHNGMLSGPVFSYENNKIKAINSYVDNALKGANIDYAQEGYIAKVFVTGKDQQDGMFYSFYEDGSTSSFTPIKQDMPDGFAFSFDTDDLVFRISHLNKGVKSGKQDEFKGGSLVHSTNYVDNKQNGPETVLIGNGNKLVYFYENDNKRGEVLYDNKGKVLYYKDVPAKGSGNFFVTYKDGSLKALAPTYDGNVSGTVKVMGTEGSVLYTIEVYNGKPLSVHCFVGGRLGQDLSQRELYLLNHQLAAFIETFSCW